MTLKFLACTTAMLAAVAAAPAIAQTATPADQAAPAPAPAPAPAAAPQSDSGLSDIVVTAQRRTESQQNVPIAITAFSAAQLEAKGITNTLALAQYVPNMIAMNNTGLGSANSFYIRGLGNTETIPTFDTPVGTYIDDVYMSRQNANNLSLFDVKRVEVLRGPQGTLFGRNTTGGAINVIMAQPNLDHVAGFAEAGYGSYNKKLVRGSIDVPIADTFAIKVSGYWQNDDGYVKDVTTGQRLNDDDGWGVRLGVRGELASWAHWNASYTHILADGENILNFACNPKAPTQCDGRYSTSGLVSGRTLATSAFAPLTVSGRKANFGQGNYTQSNIVTSNLAFDVTRNATLTFITGYISQAQQYALDFYDGRSGPSLANPNPAVQGYSRGGYDITNDGKSDQFSQEVKLNGSIGTLIDYVAGFYYIKENVRTDFADIFSTSASTALLLADRVLTNQTEAYAGYAQGDLNVTSQLKLTAGIRYTDETKTFQLHDNRAICNTGPLLATCLDTRNLVSANGVAIPTSQNVKIWTPRFAVNFKPGKDLLLFASATKGFRSGGWNARATSPTTALPFGPEKVWSYETGIKSELFDRHVRANLTFFYEKVKDFQTPSGLVSPTGAVSFITRNFADYRNMGIEAEFDFAVTRGLNLFANGGYSNDKYLVNYNAPALDVYGTRSVASQQALCKAAIAAGAVGGGTGTTGVCGVGIVTATGQIATPVRTPDFTLAFGGSYSIPLGELSLVPTVNASWHSKQEVQTANLTYYTGSSTGTNGTFPANTVSGDFITGSYSAPLWQVNAGISLNGPGKAWSLSVNCTNCFDTTSSQSLLGYTYLNPPRMWMVKAKHTF
jgi:iron complex outermembrane receptor protein